MMWWISVPLPKVQACSHLTPALSQLQAASQKLPLLMATKVSFIIVVTPLSNWLNTAIIWKLATC